MRYKVRGGAVEPLNLTPKTTLEEVIQNIAIILVTPKGSVPLYRNFGLSQEIVDKPMQMVEPLLIGNVIDAIEAYEQRVKVTEVTFEYDDKTPGRVIPIVEVEIAEEELSDE